MRAGVFFLLIPFLAGCNYNNSTVAPNSSLPTANPLRETYFDVDSGDKISENLLEYNDNGKVVHETFSNIISPAENTETFYEYNADGSLAKKRIRMFGYGDMSFVNFFKYQDGLLSIDSSFYDTNPGYYSSKHYFYGSDALADSIRLYQPMIGRDELYAGSSIYHRDLFGRLVSETYTLHVNHEEATLNEYTYDGNNMVKSCNEGNCIFKDYNEDGLVVKIAVQYGQGVKRVTEEYSYTNKILTEKILYLYNSYITTDQYTSRTRVEFAY